MISRKELFVKKMANLSTMGFCFLVMGLQFESLSIFLFNLQLMDNGEMQPDGKKGCINLTVYCSLVITTRSVSDKKYYMSDLIL